MGAWGEKAFENDAALDWLAELEAAGATAVLGILEAVASCDPEEDLDVDDGSAAIAAAEVVAAALGHGRDRVPKDVAVWLDANDAAFGPGDRDLARRAVERVSSGGESELRELWEEGGPDSDWHVDVRLLLVRLGADRSTATAPKPAKTPATAKPDVRSLQVLLTFLQARGLEPTETQLARLRAPRDAAELRGWLARVVDAPSVAALLGDE